jgi:hypothetical protein
MKTKTPRTTVTLRLPLHVPDLIKLAQAIVQALTGNPHFPNPVPPLAIVIAAIAALDAAETATKTRAKGTIEIRDAAYTALVKAMRELKVYVQGVCDANPDQAATIVASALMNVRKPAVRTRHDFVAKHGPTSG